MPRAMGETTITISALDRLIDLEPENRVENPLSRTQSVRLLKSAVRRDLEWLLNTRQIAFMPPEGLRELNRSAYVYGLPDFTSYNLGSTAAEAKITRQLQATLKYFEPRLAKVRLIPLEPFVARTRTFRFRIEALLMMDPQPEHVSFDTVLQLTTNQYEVQNAG